MVYKRKSTGGSELDFELEDEFVQKMKSLSPKVGISMAKKIDQLASINVPILPYEDQEYGAVVHFDNDPVFFGILLYRDSEDIIILADVFPISSDEYLDFINDNKALLP